MDLGHGIEIDDESVASFCAAHGVKRLALFGSVLGDRFGEQSDVDVLVEFEAGRTPQPEDEVRIRHLTDAA